jgi:hypothetical protein
MEKVKILADSIENFERCSKVAEKFDESVKSKITYIESGNFINIYFNELFVSDLLLPKKLEIFDFTTQYNKNTNSSSVRIGCKLKTDEISADIIIYINNKDAEKAINIRFA